MEERNKPTALIFETKPLIPKVVCIVIKITNFLLKLSLIKNTTFGISLRTLPPPRFVLQIKSDFEKTKKKEEGLVT